MFIPPVNASHEVYMVDKIERKAEVTLAPYGEWKSPITAEKVAEGSKKMINMVVDGDNVYWNEVRPENKGRYTVVKRTPDGKEEDLTPPEFNARSAVHEYGGGAFSMVGNVLLCSNFTDKKVYIKGSYGPLSPITDGNNTRFAEMIPTFKGIFAVGEEHIEGKEAENFIALINPDSGTVEKVATGYDFYSSPTISEDGKKIAYICWNHPHMPWTNTELWMADIDEKGHLHNSKQVAGEMPESIFQPRFSKEGQLYFITDRDEWWNLYRLQDDKVERVVTMEAEMGWPLWQLARSKWAFLGDKILFTYQKEGFGHLGLLDPTTGKWEKLDRSGSAYQQLRQGNGFVTFIEEFENSSNQIVRIDADTLKSTVIKPPKEKSFDEGVLTKPEHITYKSGDGREAYGYFYPPQNNEFRAPEGELPPLIVMIHGGPTAKTSPSFALKNQYWTSQGFAILDVDYGGSTGYGRTYRMALNDKWGIVDVEDCVYGAKHLIEQGLVDPNNVFIRGGSAGGFTTLAALTYDDTFKGGGDYYGVADLEALAGDTHKFESRYLDNLLGAYSTNKDIWKERSPINHIDRFNAPLIIFQGTEDKVVPPNQAEMIYDALKTKGVKTELHLYEGEQHGFRQKKNIIDSLEKEADFYRSIIQANKGS